MVSNKPASGLPKDYLVSNPLEVLIRVFAKAVVIRLSNFDFPMGPRNTRIFSELRLEISNVRVQKSFVDIFQISYIVLDIMAILLHPHTPHLGASRA